MCNVPELVFYSWASHPSAFVTHQSQERKVCSCVDRAGNQEVNFHVDTPPAQFRSECAGHSVPEIVNGYALEDGNEDAGDGEADDKVVAIEEDAAELEDGEDAVLE